ncbi:DUF3489 domain-containing protein [Roseospira visakhapatnamensis]|uniref:DUF3489 domain-containing protein n=1 Tax=Roseospira visakhapatnamensis TaxID=390880 RepID=A0A7W6RFQ2_9PROT|nr:DUF3489 domain-containing protein [Roseospira visakhapatnamensis]MBB4267607.1 hypothetical protein [Roseospira visakhapatnamensis]
MTQIDLSETQRTILGTACAREDRMIFPVTAPITGGAVGNVLKSLLKRGLIEEVVAEDETTVWRHDEDRGPITLRATELGVDALADNAPVAPLGRDGDHAGPDMPADETDAHTAPAGARHRVRGNTKQAIVVDMLRRPEGATIAELVEATGWQSHTVRGCFAGALKKKLGLTITSEKEGERGRVYKLNN